ncbi:MAG: colanic acid biosynthesis glycosyltransferase WcaL [Opitutus sp.]|nr:colanic acid biosynthesis glycosyltransferase WcaL [Opitutus sp.]
MPSPPLKVAFLFTTFPKTSETFLQRDVAALLDHGVDVRLYSLFGGGGEFCGRPVRRFNLWRLVPLFLLTIPWNCLRRPRIVRDLFEGVIRRAPPSWMNFWENMLGAGFAGCFYREFRRDPPDLVHGAWAGAPATAGWLLWRLLGIPFSCGAHAYDLYEHGGDWWLLEKLRLARFVQASTETGRRSLIERGVPAEKIRVVRRGLDEFPVCKPLRRSRRPLRLLCVARLVPKKGLDRQLHIYDELRREDFPFEARIAGDGPLRAELAQSLRDCGLERQVALLGQLPHAEVWRQLDWADVLLHTGVVAPSGDRDGLPNVIPEAMAAGVLVVSSPVSATTEAVRQERTGLVCDADLPLAWRIALTRLADDDALAERLRGAARAWVEENYDARKNTARLVECFASAARR